jgi:hypothetical protein
MQGNHLKIVLKSPEWVTEIWHMMLYFANIYYIFCFISVSCTPPGLGGGPKSAAKEITSFAFRATDNPGLDADVTGTIKDTMITLIVPFGTDISSLKVAFVTTGVSVTVNGNFQQSGKSINDFTNPVTYTVKAEEESTQDYLITVSVALPGSNKDITVFSFLKANNPHLTKDISGEINGTSITVIMSSRTDVTALIPTFITTGFSVTMNEIQLCNLFNLTYLGIDNNNMDLRSSTPQGTANMQVIGTLIANDCDVHYKIGFSEITWILELNSFYKQRRRKKP